MVYCPREILEAGSYVAGPPTDGPYSIACPHFSGDLAALRLVRAQTYTEAGRLTQSAAAGADRCPQTGPTVPMKTFFYDRTAYSLSDEPVPNCFLKLDEHFDTLFSDHREFAVNRSVLLAESVCSRMADVEMYAFLMEDVRKRKSVDRKEDDRAAILTRSFLLGFIGASRALLDSCAVTLATLYELPLAHNERTFANSDYWREFVLLAPAVHRRYHPLRLFFNEILRWQHETVYRLPPLVALHSHYGHLPGRDAQLRVVDDTRFELGQLAQEPYAATWIDPLELYARWKPRLLSLCEKVCQDIESRPVAP